MIVLLIGFLLRVELPGERELQGLGAVVVLVPRGAVEVHARRDAIRVEDDRVALAREERRRAAVREQRVVGDDGLQRRGPGARRFARVEVPEDGKWP